MSNTLTLRNIPDNLYVQLKASAAANQRSLNLEAIACLESGLLAKHISPTARIARAGRLRASLPEAAFLPEDIDTYKREGRR